MVELISNSAGETIKIGKRLARHLTGGDIICLFGQLGSGKTVLVKGIAEGLGVKRNDIFSPTFVLIHEYNGRIPLYHFDLYRLNRGKDILSLGYEEYFYGDGITVVEWADRLKPFLPAEFLRVELFIKSGSTRKLRLGSRGNRYRQLLKRLV